MFKTDVDRLRKQVLTKIETRIRSRITYQSTLQTLAWAEKYLTHYFDKPFNALHLWLCKEIDTLKTAREYHSCVVGPRGNAKSTFYSLVLPLRNALENLDRYIMLCADTVTQAEAYLGSIKLELEGNEELAKDYPNVVGEGPTWREDRIVLKNGVIIEAIGTGSKIRGRRRAEVRPTLVIVDDPENDEHRESAKQREKSWNWLQRSLLKMGKTEETNYVVVGTAIHRECMALRLTKLPRWKSMIFKSIITWPLNMELWEEWKCVYFDVERPDADIRAEKFYEDNKEEMDRGSKVLWPAAEPLYKLMCMWSDDAGAFDSEKQGNPINPEACEWPESYFDHENFWFWEWPSIDDIVVKVMAQDPSKGKDAKTGDYSCNLKLAIDKFGVIYVDCDMKRRTTDVMVEDAVYACRRFTPHAFAVETNLYQELLVAVYEQKMAEHQVNIPVVEIENKVKKEVRIRRLTPYLARRRIRLKAGSPGVKLLVNQMKDFPNAAYDDGPDAFEMALRVAIAMFNGDEDMDDCVFEPLGV